MHPKKIRGMWHKENRPFVFDYFKGICQVCQKPIEVGRKWDIHHKTYNYHQKLYETDAEQLIKDDIIILICRNCHNLVHTAKDNNNPKHDRWTLENRGICEVCGRNERGIFDRKKHQKLDKLICRKCFLQNKISNKYGVTQTKLF